MLLGQLGIETQRGSYNQTPGSPLVWPDFLVITDTEVVGCNRKQAVEAMADLDKVEDQLFRELGTTAKLCFLYEGCLTYTEDGVYAGDAESVRVVHHTGRSGNEYDVLTSRGRVVHQSHTRWTRFQWKCQDVGIPVVSTGSIRGTAAFLHSLHEGHQNNLFQRLIPTRQAIAETDWELRSFAETLMGIRGANWGQEMALAAGLFIKDWLDKGTPLTIRTLVELDSENIADIKLKSGRRIGPAAAKRMITALGWGETGVPA